MFQNLSKSVRYLIYSGILLVSLLAILGIGRATFLTFVDNYELGYEYNTLTGKTTPLLRKDGTPKTGYFYTVPFYKIVHTIDLRPCQVCINANSRVLNCKLVEFNPDGLKTFIAWHGRGDYEGGVLEDILKSYAYDPSGNAYSFMTIKKELKNTDVIIQNTVKDTLIVDTLSNIK